MATVAVVVVTEVILRYGAGTSLIITEELSRYGMIWVALLASVLVLREEGHIATGAGGWLGPRGQRALRVVAELLSLLFLVVLAVAGLQVLPAQRDQDTLTLGVTIFWFYLALPVSALLMVVFALTMTLGVPIAFCLGLAGLTFIVLSGTVPIAVLPTLMFGGMDSFPLLAIPFFIIAGDLMQRCGVLPKLIEFANSLVGHLRGGLAYVVVLTSMLFAGVTGVALAECAAIGSMLAASMVRQGYPGGFVSSVVAGSAVMGPIIPPSVAMLIYAYVYGGGISVGKLFLMGVVPGVLVAVALMALVWVSARQRHFPKSDTKFSLGGIVRSLRGALLGLVVPVIILGGILGGVFTPTEAGAVAALYAVLIGVFVLRTLGLRGLG